MNATLATLRARLAYTLTFPRPTPRQLAFCALAAAVGYALNYLSLPVVGGTVLVFGSVMGLLVAVAYGPYCGGTVAALAFLPTWSTWGHPHGIIVFGIESWVVGWLVHRRGMPLWRAGLIYWAFVGLPLTAFLILEVFRPSFPANWAIVFKYPANGMLVIMLAQTIVHLPGFWRLLGELAPRALRHESLRDHLLRRLVVATAWPALVFGVTIGVIFNFESRSTLQRELGSSANEIAGTVTAYLRRHQQTLETAASALDRRAFDAAELMALLEELRRRNPGFLTMLAADETGRVTANSPLLAPGVLTSVADREYFRRPEPAGRAYVSPVFRGRGFGDDLIVAVSAAYVDAEGRRHVIEGSLDLRQMNDEISRAPNLGWREVLVFDGAGETVFFSQAGAARSPRFATLPRGTAGDLVNDDTTVDEDGQRYRKYGIWQEVPEFGWWVYLREDAWRSVMSIARFYLAGAATLSGILIIGLLLSRQTVQRLSKPFSQLVEITDAVLYRRPPPAVTVEEDVPEEWRRLVHDVSVTASALAAANQRLKDALAERDASNTQLQRLTDELERRVQERTAELERARAEAERASRAKSDFLAVMSHELRTPLNVQLGHIFILLNQRDEKLSERQAGRVRQIKASADQLLVLINDILDLAKLEAGRTQLDLESVDLRKLCQDCADFFREEFVRAKLQFTLSLDLPDHPVPADARRLRQVLLNLLSNAVKFTPEGGSVGLTAREDAGRDQIVFTVWDTGIGIDAEAQKRLFRPFEQADHGLARRYAGTGLGLTIVKHLAMLHGGQVELESAPGQGSRFTVRFPRGVPAAKNSPETPS